MAKFNIDVKDSYWKEGLPSPLLSNAKVIKGDEIITKAKTIKIRYTWADYLETNEEFVDRSHTNSRGWTRTRLRAAIRKDYREFDRKNMMWGHVPGDLVIEGVYYNPRTKSFTLNFGS